MASQVPSLSLTPKVVSFEEEKTNPFLSPRGMRSGLAHFSPRSQMDSKSDALLQGTVEKVWLETLNQIEMVGRIHAQYVVEIPYSQGLLFAELLSKHPAIKKTTVDKIGKLTLFFKNSSDRNENYIQSGLDRISSESSLPDRMGTYFPIESFNYLRKFLEISEKMLNSKRNKFSVSVTGFDREFFKAALFCHYPNYIHWVASKRKQHDPGKLEVVLPQKKHNEEELREKIKRLKALIKQAESSISVSSGVHLRYSDPAGLEENPLFLRRKSIEADSDSSLYFRIGSPSSSSMNKIDCKKESMDLQGGSVGSPGWVQNTESEILSDSDLGENRNEYENRVVQDLMQLIKDRLGGAVPKKTQSENWRALWRQIENASHSKLNQVKIRDIISLKLRLEQASFDLPAFLNETQMQENLSKADQMHSIPESEIIRSIYPDAVNEPAVTLKVNKTLLVFEKCLWDGTSSNVQDCFRKLLSELLYAQYRYNEESLEQLFEDLSLTKIHTPTDISFRIF